MQTAPSELAARLIRANAAPVTVASACAVQNVELRLSDDASLATRVVAGARARAVHAVDLGRVRPRTSTTHMRRSSARFLRAAGAPSDERGALYRYNPSSAYVDAVERYAGRIRRSARAFAQYCAGALVVRTRAGYRRLR
jgi:hypothetical protein